MFQILYCDYDRHNPDYDRIYRPHGGGSYLFLHFFKPMKVRLMGKPVTAKPDACLLYTPEFGQDYRALKEFENSYVHFQTDKESRKKLEDLGIPLNQVFYPGHPEIFEPLFGKLREEFLTKKAHSNLMMDALLLQMFVLISRLVSGGSSLTGEEEDIYRQFQMARLKLLTQCEKAWNTDSMCRLVHMGKSQFYSYYVRFFRIPPKSDLLNARMERAKNLLTNEALQIQRVAELCGFANASHFSRQFKKRFGCAPGRYFPRLR